MYIFKNKKNPHLKGYSRFKKKLVFYLSILLNVDKENI